MKNSNLVISILKRLLGVIFLVLNYLCYGVMIALAADSDLSSNERIIYPILVYLLSWGFLLAGIYLAGPEIVNKIKYYYNLVKSKFIKGKQDDKKT
ncbi:hypothetical protein OAP13_03480 [Gammaproteobacteria bacterium]|nr:hypothetical protein [SAR86 cluster bacterium]MDA7554201.1 hypothetical protein [Gammaproteobacteria bacterium]MDC0545740.1 hypothetical protein [Gammaproteobacteria bacterium]MDC0576884.1 hypothetical protein [Gammaproteobacteria bacterium]MDC0590954.1 hypothetical protein [Gammaproteobacteria bacterium]